MLGVRKLLIKYFYIENEIIYKQNKPSGFSVK